VNLPRDLAKKCLELAGAVRDADEIEVPPPPSANGIWRIVRGTKMTVSDEYKRWAAAVAPAFERLRVPAGFPVTVVIVVRGGKGWTTSRDLDNAIKPLIDAVKKSGTIPDDTTAYVTKIEATYVPGDGRPAGVRVRVEHKGEPPCPSQR